MAPSFNNIVLGGKANKGVLRLNEHGFGWKDPHGKSVTVMRKELKAAASVLVGPSRHKLLLSIGDEREVSFEGLGSKDLASIVEYAREQLGLEIPSRVPCTVGWNWGATQFEGKKMQFMVGGQLAFEMPLANVSQCQQLKKEVSIEIHREEEALTESLTGITLWSPADDFEGAKNLHKTIMSKADMLSTSGGEIITLPQVQLKVPRGKYDIEIYSSLMRLKGTQSFTLLYDNITRISWMKTTDDRYFYIVLSVHPPLRRGHTHYPHILIQIKDEDTLDIEASMSEEDLKEKFGGKLSKKMSGSKFEVIFNVLRDVTGKRLTRAGKFQSAELPAVRTSLKANDGYLYPMEKCFFFVPSPPIFIKYSSCTEVEFARVSGASGVGNRTFDLVIFHSSNQTYVFKNIDKEEYEPLYAYLRTKNLTLKSDQQDEISASDKLQMQMQMLGEDSDEDDDDFGSDDEDAVVASGGEESDDDDEDESGDDDDEEDDEDSDDGAISEDELAALQEDAEDVASYGKGKRKRRASNSPGSRPAKKQKTEE